MLRCELANTPRPHMYAVELVTPAQASIVEQIGEGQFSEVKAKEIAASKLGKSLAAFANSDGGDG